MASSTSLQVAGLASNFDWKSFVDQIMAVEHAPADRLTEEKQGNSLKVTQLSALGTRLADLQTSSQALNSATLFGGRTATSSGSDSSWNTSAATDAAIGSYKISVSQLAAAAKVTGANDVGAGLNPTGDSVSGLTLATLPIGQAVTAGTFTVNGAKVTIGLTDSLQDVFNAISTATGGDVTAGYDHLTDKITLTSTNGNVMLGAANDTSNFLRALKLGNNGTTTVSSSAKLGTVKTNAALSSANLGTSLSATSGSFSINGVSISYDASVDSLSTMIKRINASSAGVSASYDAANDRMTLTNQSTGDLGISASDTTGNFLAALGLASGTTFTRGQNAEFTVNDGDVLSSASNTLDASSTGIDGLSVTVNSEDTQTIDVKSDTSSMRSKIEDFISKFNSVQQFIDDATKISTDSKGKVTAATLSDNREVQEWSRSLRTMAFASISGLSGTIARLDDMGIDFTAGTSNLAVKDSAKLDSALTSHANDVQAFFTSASTGFATKFDSFLTNVTKQNTDQQTNLTKANDSLDDQIAAIERRLDQQREVMESAFINMETAQSKIKQQQTAIDGITGTKSS